MSLQDIFTDEQIVILQRAPLDVAALAAEADMELEEVELEELSIQLNTYDQKIKTGQKCERNKLYNV